MAWRCDAINSSPDHAETPLVTYSQQYLSKIPWGYRGLGGTGVSCSVGLTASE